MHCHVNDGEQIIHPNNHWNSGSYPILGQLMQIPAKTGQRGNNIYKEVGGGTHIGTSKKISKGMCVNYRGPRKVARKHAIRIYPPITLPFYILAAFCVLMIVLWVSLNSSSDATAAQRCWSLFAVEDFFSGMHSLHACTGWWFGCHFLFSHILGIIIPIDVHIFQRGGPGPPTRCNLVGWVPSLNISYLPSDLGGVGNFRSLVTHDDSDESGRSPLPAPTGIFYPGNSLVQLCTSDGLPWCHKNSSNPFKSSETFIDFPR